MFIMHHVTRRILYDLTVSENGSLEAVEALIPPEYFQDNLELHQGRCYPYMLDLTAHQTNFPADYGGLIYLKLDAAHIH